MVVIRGCYLPEELYYDVEKQVWARPLGEEGVLVGMTDMAQKLAGKILYATVKKAGKVIERGKSAATIETEKWVGPLPLPLTGELVEANELLKADPTLINRDPYGRGWIIRIRPTRLEAELGELLTGTAAIEAYRKKMEAEEISCER